MTAARAFGFALACLAAGCAIPVAPPSMAVFDSHALQGDISGDAPALRQLDPGVLAPAERARRECLLARFVDGQRPAPGSGDDLLDALLDAYREYWTDSLLRRGDKTAREEVLHKKIDAARQHFGGALATPGLDEATQTLPHLLEGRGFHAITGITLPYYELMAWRTNDTRNYDVALPEQSMRVTVVLMDGFASLGWSAWATCDRSYSGGWATRAAIYAVRRAYDLDSEAYRVNLLVHESQHFADYVRFPKLEQPELEYRGKLAEIARSEKSTRDLVTRFAVQGGESREAPHSWANAQVSRELRRALGVDPALADAAALRSAAETLLRESSAQLERQSR
jgi:hypothetical protein